MAFVQFTQPDDQPIVINTDRIVTATPLPDGQGTRITFNNGGHQDLKQLIADVLRQLNISAWAQDIAAGKRGGASGGAGTNAASHPVAPSSNQQNPPALCRNECAALWDFWHPCR